MRGLLADVNVQGHLPYLRQRLEALDLWELLVECAVDLTTFRDLGLDPRLDDRSLWNYCQQEEWMLFTENRQADGVDSLEAVMAGSWKLGCLPVVTLGNKGKFEHSRTYANQVAAEVAEVLFGIAQGEYRDQPRIFVPR